MFPKEEQNRIRITLASVLGGVVSQRLVKTVDGKRAAAIEVMKQTPRIAELIAQNRDYEILDTIEEGKEIYGSQSFDQALLALYNEKRIDEESVLEHATNPSDMKLKLQGIGTVVSEDEKEENEKVKDIFDLKSDEE
jgi:twitching motility protein PilT